MQVKLNHAILALASAGLFSTQACAKEADGPLAAFTEADMSVLFVESDQPMQMAALSGEEMRETEGAWVWWASAGALGGAMNTIGYIGSNPNWSYRGAAYSFLSGASGGLIAALPGGNVARLGYSALGAYTAMQPWGGYSWSRW